MVTVDPDTIRETLAALLKNELAATGTLSKVLGAEHKALINNDATALEVAIKDKVAQLETLAALSDQRHALLENSGYSPDATGLEACIRHNDIQRRLASQWQAFTQALDQCKRQNQINAGIVELSHQQVSRSLDVLRGCATEPELYDPHGRATGSNRSRPIASA